MSNVTSLTVSSSSELKVRRSATAREEDLITKGPVRVELREQPDPPARQQRSITAYRVNVGAALESRKARKVTDELKKRFFEPVTMSFDAKEKGYFVLIGEFATRNEATRMLDRLRKAGYEDLRIVTETKATDKPKSEKVIDTNARAEKHKAQPSASAADPFTAKTKRTLRIVAVSPDKTTVSSEDELIVYASDDPRLDKGHESTSSAASKGQAQPTRRDSEARGSNERSSAASEGTSANPATIRVGDREYRGEIHLVLNSRARINVVNTLPLEEYLRGVVPMELSPSVFPQIEALKAQAVAARSYALANLGRHSDDGFDLVDDTRAQVYGGFSAERELTNRAVEETRGIFAVFPNEDGKLAPIEAMYTANCGGRTENNEEVFGGKPVPYLRAVACSLDRQSLDGQDIVTNRIREPLIGIDGRSIARETALLSVLGFSLPRRVANNYLRGAPDQDEVRSWTEQAARVTQREKPEFLRGDLTRLAEFVRIVAGAIYGAGRASTLLAPADVDYLLAGLRVEQLPRDVRADVAMLLRDGILRVPADGVIDGRATITRGQAIETLARAVLSRSQTSDLKSQGSNLRFQIPDLRSELSAAAEKGRLVLAKSGSANNVASRAQGPRFTSVNASAPGRVPRAPQGEAQERESQNVTAKDIATPKTIADSSLRSAQPSGLEIAEGAWLFRSVGGESYAVDRLTIIGGERVTYHLNTKGQADFLEASMSERSASSDRFSTVAQWQERISVEDLQQRLARARVNVGRLESVEPVAFSSSSRVTDVEVTGDKGHARLRRPQIRSALGLKEYLFVVDRETDARGRVVAFVFTGRGWGHGVGMCQTGAYGLAKEGYSYTAILQKYYTGVKLQKMY